MNMRGAAVHRTDSRTKVHERGPAEGAVADSPKGRVLVKTVKAT